METVSELNKKIIEVTMKIQQKHPELMNFLNEMPVTIPNEKHPHINISVLKKYYESLLSVLEHSR
jgi:hypothetical protein